MTAPAPAKKKPVKKKTKKAVSLDALMREIEAADFRKLSRADQKILVEDWLGAALDLVDAGGDVTPWQTGNLAEAAGALLAGLYGLAPISLRLALTVDEATDDPWYRVSETEFAGVTTDALRQAVTASRAQPVVAHPVLRAQG
jgi:hypothetical protein